MWCETTTAGSGQGSSTVTRRSAVCGGSFGRSRGTGCEAFGTRPTVAQHELHGFCRVEVAHEHQRRIRRHVVGAMEVAHIVDRRGLQIFQAADGWMFVGCTVKAFL